MKFKKICLSTQLGDLYGRDEYHSHIELNREYWCYFAGETKISDKYGPGWYKLKVTYIRSGCMFYIFPDYPDIEEDFCPIRCFMTSVFELAEIDPIKDIIKDNKDNDYIKKYRFDDTRTVVKNWDNSEYLEINENDLYTLKDGHIFEPLGGIEWPKVYDVLPYSLTVPSDKVNEIKLPKPTGKIFLI